MSSKGQMHEIVCVSGLGCILPWVIMRNKWLAIVMVDFMIYETSDMLSYNSGKFWINEHSYANKFSSFIPLQSRANRTLGGLVKHQNCSYNFLALHEKKDLFISRSTLKLTLSGWIKIGR